MAKNMTQAILEAIQAEMRRDKLLTLLYEYQRPGLNLEVEFGRWRVRYCAIDEQWIVGAALGMSMIGVRAVRGRRARKRSRRQVMAIAA